MCWMFESPCSKVMEIPSCPSPGYPCRVYSGLPSTFAIWISFSLFPLGHSWSGIGSRSSFQTSLEKVKGVMRSSLGSWTPDFNNRTRFCVCVCVCVCVLIRGKLLYNVLVSAVQHRKSAVTIHISPPSRGSLPSPQTPLGHHRARPGSLCYTAACHRLPICTR